MFFAGFALCALIVLVVAFTWIRPAFDGGLSEARANMRKAQDAERSALVLVADLNKRNRDLEKRDRDNAVRVENLERQLRASRARAENLEREIARSGAAIVESSGLIEEFGDILDRAIIGVEDAAP